MAEVREVEDPVCGMMCDPETSKWRADYEGQTYHFCAESCLREFRVNPKKYLKPQLEQHEPPYTTKNGFTAPRFGSATSGGGEFELLPEAHGRKAKTPGKSSK